MAKLSVKKPFTILVAVLICIILGFVSLTRMTTDLLPAMSLPYMVVVTTYAGASPDRVESEVAEPLEQALGTVSNVKNVMSVAAENYSMIQLEFEDGTNMDSAMVKVSSAVNQAKASLPDGVGTPNIMEISMNMIATMYLAVNKEGADVFELSDYVNDEVRPYLERVNGIASISNVGLVERSVQVELNQRKIDSVNDRILEKTNSALKDAKNKLEDAKDKVNDGQKQLEEQEGQFGSQIAQGLFGQLNADGFKNQIQHSVSNAIGRLNELSGKIEQAEPILDQQLTDAAGAAQENLNASIQRAGALAAQSRSLSANDVQAAAAAGAVAAQQYFANLDMQTRIAESIAQLQVANEQIQNSQTIAELTQGVSALMTSGADINSLAAMIAQVDMSGALTAPLDNTVTSLEGINRTAEALPTLLDGLENGVAALFQGQLSAAVGFSTATQQLSAAQAQLENALSVYNTQKNAALKNANINSLVSASTLSQLVYAQNFEMPAGYIDDQEDRSWLLKVGDEYESSGAISDALLADIDDIGTIRISDIADVTVIDNADASYTRLNGEPAVVLALFKGSTAGTNEVSRAANAAIQSLEQNGEGLHIVTLMDQGVYITQIVNDILMSMALGALLAVIVLALFLRDVRPTIIVGISIPLSVLFTIVLMYFSGLSLNIMTLGGLSLGIGMLVDNSIVVMENIIRLRHRGMTAARAAVQGTKQVGGAILASTLTTVCVFLPMIFATGTVRELLLPMALSITYCLTASLIVAMTVVPASASVILRNSKPKKEGLFERILEVYDVAARWVLHHKLITVGVAAALLTVSVIRLVTMGIVILPEMTSDNVQVTIETPAGNDKETSHQKVDAIMASLLNVAGVSDAGVMDSAATTGLISSMQSNTDAYGNYIVYVTLREGMGTDEINRTVKLMEEAVADFDSEVSVSTGGMSDLQSMTGSGLSINIYGAEEEKLTEISESVMEEVRKLDGFEEISNGSENDQKALHLNIDKNKAMSYGLTVAQIYAQIASRMTTDVTSTSIRNGAETLKVTIKNETDPLTRENILDMEFDSASAMGASSMGGSSMMGAMGGSSAMSSSSAMGSASMGDMASMMGGSLSDDEEEEEEETVHKLREFASLEETTSPSSISRQNQKRYLTVSATTKEGYNTTLLSRKLETGIKKLQKTLPEGYSIEFGGETTEVSQMVKQMSEMLLLAMAFIYFVMVAQFQSLLSPFIILFTIPLAFTGGMIGLIATREPLSMMALMGFLVLMGTVVNNGIVFVDYTNQLRIGGMERQDALIATGRTRMRPILMTTLTTVLAMTQLIFGTGMGAQLSRGMAIVISGGLIYATFMTLFVIPCMYDIFYKKKPLSVDVGNDLDEVPDDAAEFLAEKRAKEAQNMKTAKQEITEK